MNVSALKHLKYKSEGAFGNNVKLTKPLKSFVNRNGILEYGKKLAPIDAPSVAKNVQSQALVPQQQRWSDDTEKSKM